MEIDVIEDDLVGNILAEFHRQYPFLRLRCYRKPHAEGTASASRDELDAGLPIADVTMFHTGGRIDISPGRTVAEVEADFYSRLGLCIQVLRRSGSTWLTTTATDGWTLGKQNEKGRMQSPALPYEAPEDVNLQDTD